MFEYFEEQEYFIDRLWFYYDKSLYDGTGHMRWNPEKGFHIVGRVDRKKPHLREKYIGAFTFDRRPSLRMKLENGVFAYAPRIRINDFQLLLAGQVSFNLRHLFLIQKLEEPRSVTSWIGDGLIETASNLTMPDRVTSETRIGNWRPSQGFSWSGIHFEKDDEVVIGRLRDKSKLNLNWSLPRASWKKDNAWRFAEALQDSLSMISGEVTQLRYQRSYRGTHLVSEIRAGYKTSALGLVFRLFDYDIVNKELWLHLARFLSQNTLESDICKRIFRQISDAAQQNTRQGTELLSATILEAALRSLYNHPFSPELNKRTDSFKLEAKLRTFQEQYLSQDILTSRKWRRVNGRLVEAQRRLRDRNAHPDWLSTPGGSFSPEELKQSTNDLIFLSRYYGYMILALSGRKDLQPVFPASIDKWKPIVQVNTTHPADVTESSEQTTSENEEE